MLCLKALETFGIIVKDQFFLSEKYLFLKNYVTSEGAVSQNVSQQLSIAAYQVVFYANN